MLCIRCTYVSHPIHYAKGQLIGVVYHNHHIVCKIEFFVKFFFFTVFWPPNTTQIPSSQDTQYEFVISTRTRRLFVDFRSA